MKKMFFIYITIVLIGFSIFASSVSYIVTKNHYDIRCKEYNSLFKIYSIIPEPMCYIEKYDVYIPLNILDKRNESIHVPINKYKKNNT